ncbi:hypothetical protein Niako_6650 [Niastella koreensis GR20-10]|uniref:Uncharacterized protein n=1 Tax=Niastella koreensis (strain DSM 17620 / KACC 11465 / NBRC 106392 / GR20-10) TaxID=700598 RepID=G8TIM1_NIAKG|nr:hypothetical protein Niako_6650 [Niastella koreensis GR20-10]
MGEGGLYINRLLYVVWKFVYNGKELIALIRLIKLIEEYS